MINTYITDVIKQILEKDVVKHKKIRNRAVFDKVMTYIINNFGATVSLSGIAEYFESQEHIKIRTETLNIYLKILENIVYAYLSAKNYRISVGRIGKLECDFITRINDEYRYIQVAMTIMSEDTEEREYKPFSMIRDNYPKYLLTIDTLLQKRDGVIHKNIIEFISANEEL